MILFADNKELAGIYLLYIISLILNVVPNTALATFGALLFLVLFIATYVQRARSKEKPVEYSHYQYIIKTIWIFSLFFVVGAIAAYFLADHSIINNMTDLIMQGTMMTPEQMTSLTFDYARANKFVFGGIFVPITIYVFYRLGKGFFLARKNVEIQNLKNWF